MLLISRFQCAQIRWQRVAPPDGNRSVHAAIQFPRRGHARWSPAPFRAHRFANGLRELSRCSQNLEGTV